MAEPSLPGTPELDSRRARLLATVKGEPLLFVRRPEYEVTPDAGLVSYRRWLEKTRYPASVLAQLLAVFLDRPEYGRSTILRDGYLYAEDQPLAEALVTSVRAEHLFTEAEIWIQRGERLLRARKIDKRYFYADGPSEGQPVRLILFDRVGSGPVAPGVHYDVRSLRYRLHFDRMVVRHLAEHHVVAELHYGRESVLALLKADGPRLEQVCETMPDGREEQVEQARLQASRKNRSFRSVQRAIARQIDDRLPFDEPKHEVDQEDGRLRRNWIWAYDVGRLTYKYHQDVYAVFDVRGRPLVPEVCVDFLLDTIERAGGTWWRPQHERRERIVGRVDFNRFDREELRRASGFVAFARAHPEWFDVLEIPERQQIRLDRAELYEYLRAHADAFVPGDMVLIGGEVPWDLRFIHYHSFFVFESDPMTGMPLLIAGNPGRPRLVPWSWEVRRTPRRTLRYRIRPKSEWLESVVEPEPRAELEPPPLSYGP